MVVAAPWGSLSPRSSQTAEEKGKGPGGGPAGPGSRAPGGVPTGPGGPGGCHGDAGSVAPRSGNKAARLPARSSPELLLRRRLPPLPGAAAAAAGAAPGPAPAAAATATAAAATGQVRRARPPRGGLGPGAGGGGPPAAGSGRRGPAAPESPRGASPLETVSPAAPQPRRAPGSRRRRRRAANFAVGAGPEPPAGATALPVSAPLDGVRGAGLPGDGPARG